MERKWKIPEKKKKKKTSDHPQTEHTFYEFDYIFNVIETHSLWSSTSFVTVNMGLNSNHSIVLFQVLITLFPISWINTNAPSLALFLHLIVDLI